MKTKEELNTLKEEIEALNGKFQVLTTEESKQVTGAYGPEKLARKGPCPRCGGTARFIYKHNGELSSITCSSCGTYDAATNKWFG